VDVLGHLVLTVVDISASFTDPSGVLQVVDLRSRQVVASHDLGGQPDSIDLSPDGRYAAVAIENERDEDVNDGQLPQPPGGWLAVVDQTGRPQAWTVRRAGGFWLASEGDGEATTNLLVEVDTGGQVVREIGLPAAVEAGATSNGFEGVAVVRDPDGREQVWVAVQREWADNPPGQVTLARFTPATGTWGLVAYPLDPAPPGGWVGLSELTAPDDDTLLVLERDNRRGQAAQVKRVYRVELDGVTPVPAGDPARPLVGSGWSWT
jgi:hypothetical protein